MPLFRIEDKIHFFAHVPKCAGASVENYLAERFGSLALLNLAYHGRELPDRWTRSSPQHVLVQDLDQLIPRDWIASSFATARNPFDRIVSEFNYQINPLGWLPRDLSFEEWFDEFLLLEPTDRFFHDNHLRPQVDFVPDGAAVFRFEDGLDRVIDHIDGLAGRADGPRSLTPYSHREDGGEQREKRPVPDRMIRRIAEFYAADFERFGYDTTPARPLVVDAAPPADAAAPSDQEWASLPHRRVWRQTQRFYRSKIRDISGVKATRPK